jgi:hypothetical protein
MNMKKFFLLSISSLFIVNIASAEIVLAPQWSEICPKSYLSAKQTRFDKDQNYWYERRLQFEESINQCKAYQGDDLKECYEKVREQEGNKNARWNTYVDAYNEQTKQEQESLRRYSERMQVINGIQDTIKLFK